MRLAYVCTDPGVPVFGGKGGSVHVQSVVRALVSKGVDVTLFARRVGGAAPEGLEGVRVVRLDRPPSKAPEEREPFLLAQNVELRDALERHGPFDMVYERHALWSFAAMEFAGEAGVPGLLEVNAPLVEEQRRYRSLVRVEDAERTAERAFAAASAMLAVSEPLGDWLRQRVARPDRVRVVPNGVDVGRFRPRGGEGDSVTIGFLGSLRAWHGVEQLLEVYLAMLADGSAARLRVIGDGPLMPWLERRSARVKGSVDLVGAVPPERVPAELREVDIAVAPYPHLDDFYFSPLKLYEYMAAGCAIAASGIGQVRDVIECGVTGLLYDPDDLDGLRSCLERLAGDSLLRERLGSTARARAEAEHGWDRVVDRILEAAGLSTEVAA